jgi:ABC-type sulfate transport system permease component
MTTLLNHPVLLFLVSLTVLALVAQAGYRLRQAYPASTQEALHEQVKDARDGIVFLLSLLLGFTLAMALTRYDHRKQLVVDEADAIGTTAL